MKQEGQRGLRDRGSRVKTSERAAPQSPICLDSNGLHHACANIIKHNMKYSLLLPLDTGFIFVEGKPLRRPASEKVITQQNTERMAG